MTIDRQYQGGSQSSIPGVPDEDEPGGKQAPLDDEAKHSKDPASGTKVPKIDSEFPDDGEMPLPND